MTRPRHLAPRHPMRRLSGRVVAVAVTLVLALAAPAHAFWTATSTGSYARAQAASLTAPQLSVGSVTATSAALSWTRPFTPTAYAVSQSPGSLTGCPVAPATSASGCTVTSLAPNTSYTWTLTASLHGWAAAATASATTSKQATSTALSNITPSSAAVGTTFQATATVTGGSGYGTPAGTVVFGLYSSATCSGGTAYTTTAQTLSGGHVTGSVVPGAGTYYWKATYTPTDTYNLASTSACSAAITVTPTSTIALNFYGVNGSVYDVYGRPTALDAGLSVQNVGGSAPRTLTSFTVTASFPDTRVSGATPTNVAGSGWSYQSVAHVGSLWVYTFGWTGSLPQYGSTSNLTFTVALINNTTGTFPSTATVTNFYANPATVGAIVYL